MIGYLQRHDDSLYCCYVSVYDKIIIIIIILILILVLLHHETCSQQANLVSLPSSPDVAAFAVTSPSVIPACQPLAVKRALVRYRYICENRYRKETETSNMIVVIIIIITTLVASQDWYFELSKMKIT